MICNLNDACNEKIRSLWPQKAEFPFKPLFISVSPNMTSDIGHTQIKIFKHTSRNLCYFINEPRTSNMTAALGAWMGHSNAQSLMHLSCNKGL